MKCTKYIFNSKNKNLIITETEPFSLFLFFPLLFYFNRVVLTIHAVNKPSENNKILEYVIKFQRRILGYYLVLAPKLSKFSIVMHSRYHKAELISKWPVEQNLVHVIDYPCPFPNSIKLLGSDLLIFGGVRPDKEMITFFNSLRDFGDQGFIINVIGNITDEEVKTFSQSPPKFINFLDKFVSDEEIEKYVSSSQYFIVPYGQNYSGGAGPIKDAASFGRPVLALNHPLFVEISTETDYCVTFSSIDEFYQLIRNTSNCTYAEHADAAIAYAKKNNWSTLRERYLEIISHG
jgi:glycosyltransferase involved in cell wall biosynthesis